MTDSDAGPYGEREGREMPSGRTEPDRPYTGDRLDNGERDDTSPAPTPPPPSASRETPSPASPDTPSPASPDTPSPASPDTPSPASPDTPSPASPDTPSPASRDTPSVDSLLAAAVRAGASADSVGEARAVAAFRAARESGARNARTRRRDDWRPNARRRVQLSIRTTLAVLLASLTLGGVAFAAIDSATRGDKGADRESGEYGSERPARPGAGASTRPGPADVPRIDPSTPATSAPAEQDGASRDPDESDRRADRPTDAKPTDDKPTDDSRRPSPRPAEPNGQNGANATKVPDEAKVPDEPGPPRVPGGDRPEPTAANGVTNEVTSEGGARPNAPQLAPEPGQKAPGTK
ncbi:hypothetical protein [Streptomyces deccanensis]|uniref:hypothetical protein n=1 Tax=Streptomyces deccanensis TaxID=424188 RepID=UPI001EFB7172|nr:hypothetical protein [Streptomyces deccanensis]ULR52996.1 hypothetical protein L3078_29035 [Streptomyces deccanensis]